MAEENNIYTPPSLVNGTVKFGNAEAITADVISAHNIQDLPDRPNAPTSYGGFSYSARDLKERFEGLARLAINAINTLINELGAETVSNNIKIPELGGMRNLGALVAAIKSGNLADNMAVDTVVDYGDLNVDEDDKNLTTLQQVLTYLTTYVSTLKTDIGNGTLADNMAVDPYDGKSTLQAVLTKLTGFVTQLNYDISHGTLAQKLKFTPIDETKEIDTLEGLSEAIRAANGKYLANYFKVPTSDGKIRNLTDIIIELLHFKETRPATVYTPKGTATAIPDILDDEGNEVVSKGDVYSIEPEGEDSFLYNGKIYPSGTNMVYLGYYDEDDKPVWDSLGGIIDYKSLASNTPVKEYSGKTKLQEVLDILSTPWDLIITDPADLGKLSTASGNVLVNLEDLYETSEVTITVSANVRLIDFANSSVSGIDAINAAVKNVVIRHLIARSRCTLKNFAVVEHCSGTIIVDSCTEVRNCTVTFANACTNIHDCTCGLPKTYTEKVMFDSCSLISNLSVISLEAMPDSDRGTVEFSNCHHISNIHCRDNDGHNDGTLAQRIHYENCTYVDPYTCAGYVQTENIGKVPVPTAEGGVSFEEFATKDDIGNIEEALRILNEGSATE